MFDLEAHIQSWKQEATLVLGPKPEVLEELESHLREAFQHRVGIGESPEHAWQLSLQELGTPEQLAGEFRKVPQPPSLLRWPARVSLGVLPFFAAAIVGLLLVGFHADKQSWLLASHVSCMMLGYGIGYIMAPLVIVAVMIRLIKGWSTADTVELRRAFLWLGLVGASTTGMGFVLGGIWASIQWGRFWNGDPREIGALVVIAWYGGLLFWVCRRHQSARAMLILGNLGHLTVTYAWFLTSMVASETQLHSYGRIDPYVLGTVAVAAELVVIALVLVPAGLLSRPFRVQHTQ